LQKRRMVALRPAARGAAAKRAVGGQQAARQLAMVLLRLLKAVTALRYLVEQDPGDPRDWFGQGHTSGIYMAREDLTSAHAKTTQELLWDLIDCAEREQLFIRQLLQESSKC